MSFISPVHRSQYCVLSNIICLLFPHLGFKCAASQMLL